MRPNAGGALAHNMQVPPPAMRRVGLRETLDILSIPALAGRKASMNADASLGRAATGFQSYKLAFERCGANRRPLVHLVGQAL